MAIEDKELITRKYCQYWGVWHNAHQFWKFNPLEIFISKEQAEAYIKEQKK